MATAREKKHDNCARILYNLTGLPGSQHWPTHHGANYVPDFVPLVLPMTHRKKTLLYIIL